MPELDAVEITCPYCWETIEILVEPADDEQEYTEDCSVCCRPIRLVVRTDPAGRCSVSAEPESG